MRKIRNLLKTKAAAILAIIILATAMGGAPTMTAQAASPKIEKNLYFRLYKLKCSAYVQIQNATKGKVTKLKNSNPSVAKVSVAKPFYATDGKYLLIEPKKAGTTKVSFYFAGKKLSTKIMVQKWENSCKVFKIGNKDYAKNFTKSEQFNSSRHKKDITAKIKITPKKDWKLLKIERMTANEPIKKIKNNSKVKLSIKWTGTGIYAYFKNTKTGVRERLYFGYGADDMRDENYYNIRIDPSEFK